MRNGLVVLALALAVTGTASAQSRRSSFQLFPGVDGATTLPRFDTRDPNVPIAVPQQRTGTFNLMNLLPNIPSFNGAPSMQSPRSTFPTPAQLPGLDYLRTFQYRVGQ